MRCWTRFNPNQVGHRRGVRMLPYLSVIALLATGCPFPPEFWVPTPELGHVLEHREEFGQSDGLQTAGLVPGTVRDDLQGLEGCFGAYSVFEEGWFFPLPDAEVYVFDPSSGEMQYMVWQSGAVAKDSATFDLAGNDRIQVTRQVDGEPWTVDALVTLDGDEMRIAYTAGDGNLLDGGTGDPDDPRVALVFRRFECP